MYVTRATSVSSWDPPLRESVWVSPGWVPTIGDLMLFIQMDSPGGTRRDVPYCLEIDFRGNGDMDTTIDGTPVSWVQTSKGTPLVPGAASGQTEVGRRLRHRDHAGEPQARLLTRVSLVPRYATLVGAVVL